MAVSWNRVIHLIGFSLWDHPCLGTSSYETSISYFEPAAHTFPAFCSTWFAWGDFNACLRPWFGHLATKPRFHVGLNCYTPFGLESGSIFVWQDLCHLHHPILLGYPPIKAGHGNYMKIPQFCRKLDDVPIKPGHGADLSAKLPHSAPERHH